MKEKVNQAVWAAHMAVPAAYTSGRRAGLSGLHVWGEGGQAVCAAAGTPGVPVPTVSGPCCMWLRSLWPTGSVALNTIQKLDSLS